MISPDIKFLVVGQYSAMQNIVHALTNELGCTDVQVAQDGVAGFGKLCVEAFDFVVTDWDMPKMSGINFLRAIRSDPALKHLPVVIVTTSGKRENIIEAHEAGASGYLIRPFSAGNCCEYLNKIFTAMNGRSMESNTTGAST